MSSKIQIVSPDTAFAESIGQRLSEWGLSVSMETDLLGVTPAVISDVDVVLLDIRKYEEKLIRWITSIRETLPSIEVILLNRAGEIKVSIEGMKAGATDELSAPFDTATLRDTVSAALSRRKKHIRSNKLSLLERFQQAMSAVTFAQSGEFETARQIMDEQKTSKTGGS